MTLRLLYMKSRLLFSAALCKKLSICTSPMASGLTPIFQAHPIVKLNRTLYGPNQANTVYIDEVFNFIVDDLGLQAAVAATGLFSGGTLDNPNGILIAVYVYDSMIIGSVNLISSIPSWLYDRFKAAGRVPVPVTCPCLSITVTRYRSKRSIAIDQIGYIN